MSPVALPHSESVDWHAASTGRHYRLDIAHPLGAPGPQGHPLLVVLDGNVYLPALAAAARMMARAVPGVGEPVVVGISYPTDDLRTCMARRTLDLTPRQPTRPAWPGDDIAPEHFGEADAFLEGIVAEVMPRVAQRVRIDTQRTALWGHSFAGLFVLHALMKRPDAFTTWLAISPSIWFEDACVLDGVDDFIARMRSRSGHTRLFMAVGEREDDPQAYVVNPGEMSAETLARVVAEARMRDNMLELAARLRTALPPTVLEVQTLLTPGETHMSAPFATLTPAFALAFRSPPGGPA